MRYTSFPDLRASTNPIDDLKNGVSRSSWCLPHFNARLDNIIAAWAYLLRAYTGEEQPIFQVNDHVVRIDLQDQSNKVIRGDKLDHKEKSKGTAVLTGKVRIVPESQDACLRLDRLTSKRHSLFNYNTNLLKANGPSSAPVWCLSATYLNLESNCHQ